MLRGSTGFYLYATFERLEGSPDINLSQGRIAFNLNPNLYGRPYFILNTITFGSHVVDYKMFVISCDVCSGFNSW